MPRTSSSVSFSPSDPGGAGWISTIKRTDLHRRYRHPSDVRWQKKTAYIITWKLGAIQSEFFEIAVVFAAQFGEKSLVLVISYEAAQQGVSRKQLVVR